VLDEPTDLPEGEDVELVLLDEVLASGGDYLDEEERRRHHESIERGPADVRSGRTVPAEPVIAKLRARTAGR
jgi:predicted transcriptional regulator